MSMKNVVGQPTTRPPHQKGASSSRKYKKIDYKDDGPIIRCKDTRYNR